MLVSEIELLSVDDYCELRAKVETDVLKEPFFIWYRFPVELKEFIDPENGNPFVAASLLPAMRAGEPLEIQAYLSPKLVQSIQGIQSTYRRWDPTLSNVTVRAPTRKDYFLPASSQNGLFFSLGVDSFYTLLKNIRDHSKDKEAISHLIVLHGFDIYYGRWNTALFLRVNENCRRVAAEVGKQSLPVVTNLRDFSDRFVDWGLLYNGAALASVGLILERMFRTIYIAATHNYANLLPWGSSPILDPLWSTEHLSFIHDGCEARRIDKVRFITEFPIVLETLRVCFTNTNNDYNCGRCEKCLRTMISLHIADALGKCKTFPNRIDVGLVRDVPIRRRTYVDELIDSLGSSETDLAIKSALEDAISYKLMTNIRRKAKKIQGRLRGFLTTLVSTCISIISRLRPS